MCTACACTPTDTATDVVVTTDNVATAFQLEGVTCNSCAGKVAAAVDELPGVVSVRVDLPSSTLTVTGSRFDQDAIRTAVRAAGYGIS